MTTPCYRRALAAAAVLVAGAGVGAAATTWYVDDDGGAGVNFTRIPDAVGNASEGDHIFVYNGTYNEDVYWGGKSLSLQGENRGNTIIDASIGTKIGIWASHGDDCVISGFTIQNGDEGINLHASNSTISNNIIFNNTGDGMSIRADNVTLVAVLAAGVVSGAGAEWDMYPGAGTAIQTATCDAGAGDTIYVHEGAYAWERGCLETGYADWRWCGHNRMPSVIKNHYNTLSTEKTV